MLSNAPFLTLLSKVDQASVKKLTKLYKRKSNNSDWFFVDYSPSDIEVGKLFDVMFAGKEKTLIQEPVQIKLNTVFDQIGNVLTFIPEGFQTVCELEFSEFIPEQIKNLPIEKTWNPNSNSISIAYHKDINLSSKDEEIIDLYHIAFPEIKNVFVSYSSTNKVLFKKDFIKVIAKKFNTKEKSIERIIGDMILLGLIHQKSNKELELVED